MKNFRKLFFLLLVIAIITISPAFSTAQRKVEKISTISKKALEQMRLEQNLDSLSIKNYQAFESTVYYFINLREKSINPLIDHLKNNKKDPEVIVPTIYTLGRMGYLAARAVPVIAPYINDGNKDVALTAIAALGKIGKASDSVVPLLYPFVFDKTEPALAHTSIVALERIKTPKALAILNELKNIELLEKKRREEAAIAAEQRQPEAVPTPVSQSQ